MENNDNIIKITKFGIKVLVSENRSNEEIKQSISGLLQHHNEKIREITFIAVNDLLQLGKKSQDIQEIMPLVVKENPKEAYNITDATIQALFVKNLNIREVILSMIKTNPNLIFYIVQGVMNAFTTEKKSNEEIQKIISLIIRQTPNQALVIVKNAFEFLITEGKITKDIQEVALALIKDFPNQMFNISAATIRALIKSHKKHEKIQETILAIIKEFPNQISFIYDGILQALIIEGKKDKDLQKHILALIKEFPDKVFKISSVTIDVLIKYSKTNKEIQETILALIKAFPDKAFNISDGSMRSLITQGKTNIDIQNIVLTMIKEFPDQTFDIVDAVVQAFAGLDKIDKYFQYMILLFIKLNHDRNLEIVEATLLALISKGKKNEDIQEIISVMIKANYDQAFYVVKTALKTLISKGKTDEDIKKIVLSIISENLNTISDVTRGVLRALISEGKTDKDIQKIILQIIKEYPDKIFDITDAVMYVLIPKRQIDKEIKETIFAIIKENPNKGFVVKNAVALSLIDLSEDIAKDYPLISLLMDNKAENKDLLNVILFYTISKYFFDKIYDDKKDFKGIEGLIIKLYNEKFNSNVKLISEIKVKNVKNLIDKYLSTVLKIKFIKSENDWVVLLINTLFTNNTSNNLEDLINKAKLEKGNFIFDDFFEDLLSNKSNQKNIQRKDFFDYLKEKGFLKEEQFNSQSDPKGFKLFGVGYLNHNFIIVFDTSKSLEKASKNKSSVVLIDSSNYIKNVDEEMPKQFRNLFSEFETINNEYQKNSTCWANTVATLKIITEDNNIKTIDDLRKNFQRENGKEISPLEKKIVLFSACNFLSKTERKDEEYIDIGNSYSIPYSESSLFNKKNLLSEVLKEEIELTKPKILTEEEFEEKSEKKKGLFVVKDDIGQKLALRYNDKKKCSKVYNVIDIVDVTGDRSR